MIVIAPASLILVFVFGILISGGSVIWFFDLPSFLLVVPPPFILVVSIGALKDFSGGLSFAFTGKPGGDAGTLLAQARVFMTCHYTALAAGGIGGVVGLVMTLVNLGEMSKIGPYLAMMLLSLFYGLILGFFFFYPVAVRLKNAAGRLS